MIDNENYEDDEELLQNKVSQLEDKLKEKIFISNNNKELLFHLKNELIEKEYRGNKTMFAEKIGVDAHYFCQVLRGKASNSSPKIGKLTSII